MLRLSLIGILVTVLCGCVTTGSTTILKGPKLNDGTPGTYIGYNYVPKVYKAK